MGILDSLRRKNSDPKNALPTPQNLNAVLTQLWRSQFASAAKLEKTIGQGQGSNDIVAICVAFLARQFQTAPIVLHKPDGTPAGDKDPMQKALAYPNEVQSEARLKVQTAVQLATGGASYWYKLRNAQRQVIGYRAYSVGDLVAVTSAENLVEMYLYNLGNGNFKTVDPADVIPLHWLNADPRNPVLPVSPLRQVIRQAMLDNAVTEIQGSTLANGGNPSTTISYPETYDLSTEQIEQIRTQFVKEHGGKNWGKPKVLTGGATLQRLSFTFGELELSKLRDIPETRIATALGIDPLALGLNVALANSSYNNKEQAQKGTVKNTIVPLWQYVADALTTGIQKERGYEGWYVSFDVSRVAALLPEPEEMHKRAVDLWNADLITRTQASQMLDLENVGADGYKSQLTFTQPQPPAAKTKEGAESLGKFKAAFATGTDWAEETKAAYWKSYNSQLDTWAEEYAEILKQTFTTLFNQQKAVAAVGTKSLEDIDAEAWLKAFKKATKRKQEQLLEDLIERAAAEVDARADEIETEYDGILRNGVAASTDKISKALYTFRDEMRELIAANNGATRQELEQLLTERFFGTIDYRVKRIARTTATVSTGVAQKDTWAALNSSRPATKQISRVWLTMRDDKVREQPKDEYDHRKADGQVEDLQGNFTISGQTCQYPADPSLSAANAINCRCITFPRLGKPELVRS